MVGLVFWESKLHVQRSHLKLTKPFGMAKTCYIRQSQHFFTFIFLIAWRRGALAGWCGKVCAGAASAASGLFWHFGASSSAHGEPFQWLQHVWIRSEGSYLREQ